MAIRFRSNSEAYSEFSNFWPSAIELDGLVWPSVEHYYQAQKFLNPAFQEKIRNAKSAARAKGLSKKKSQPRRADWKELREQLMERALRAKFQSHPDLRALLVSTQDEELIEDVAGDAFWGVGEDGRGLNKLGLLLVRLRDEFKLSETRSANL